MRACPSQGRHLRPVTHPRGSFPFCATRGRSGQRWTPSCLTSWAARFCLRTRPTRWRGAAEITWKSWMDNTRTFSPATRPSWTTRPSDTDGTGKSSSKVDRERVRTTCTLSSLPPHLERMAWTQNILALLLESSRGLVLLRVSVRN